MLTTTGGFTTQNDILITPDGLSTGFSIYPRPDDSSGPNIMRTSPSYISTNPSEAKDTKKASISGSKAGHSPGVIAGIVLGVLLPVAALSGVGMFLYFRLQKRRQSNRVTHLEIPGHVKEEDDVQLQSVNSDVIVL
ncbi:hypothetical protein ElyMa_002046100 [Elysia marginata]|uniref:Mid2 domain-containing protein n=1 Tax=Elysia marginata TaxID=1093978 RepID=A0AAV4F7F0_9GAST|nr:hypothetical protein ElyMa_002046100 [Elysia marginata]